MSKKQKSSDIKTGYYGYSSETGSSRKNTNMKKQRKAKGSNVGKALGIILVILQLIASVAFVWMFLSKGFAFTSAGVVAGIIAVLIILLAVVLFLLQRTKNAQTFGKIISI